MDVRPIAPVAAPSQQSPRLVIVVPCYNEEQVLPETMRQLGEVLERTMAASLVSRDSSILYVDDGSRDATWKLIEAETARDVRVGGVKLARNAGHQKALLAGMEAARQADCVITIDADLQDDAGVMLDFVRAFAQGYDVVYGVRRERDTDTAPKRWTALGFYRLAQMMGVDIVHNHADYRLLSRRALAELLRFEEVHPFLRGLVPLVGFPSTQVFYDRKARFAGESKYSVRKMFSFAFEGIMGFSLSPIRAVLVIGLALMAAAVIGAVAAAIAWGAGVSVPTWMYIFLSVWFLGGMQLAAIGLVGEYVGKAYRETQRRPRYIVETTVPPRVWPEGAEPAQA
jgi:glycosyltransferase involved in cell wall biosynthesis